MAGIGRLGGLILLLRQGTLTKARPFFLLTIIFLGIKAKSLVRVIGRVRETTYFMVMFSPVIYGVEDLSLRTVAVILAFFPVFYIIVEIFDRLMPTPNTFEEDEFNKNISGNFNNDILGYGGGSQANIQNPWPQAPQQWPPQQTQQARQQQYQQYRQGGYPNQPQKLRQDPRQRNRGY